MPSRYQLAAIVADALHGASDALTGPAGTYCESCYNAIEAGIADELHDTYGDPDDPYGDLRAAAIGQTLAGERLA
jgi:hypothetical protein